MSQFQQGYYHPKFLKLRSMQEEESGIGMVGTDPGVLVFLHNVFDDLKLYKEFCRRTDRSVVACNASGARC